MDPRGLLRSPKDDREKLFLCFTSIFPFIYKKHLGYFFTLSVKKTSVPQILLSRPQLQARHFNDLFEILDNTQEIGQKLYIFFILSLYLFLNPIASTFFQIISKM